MHELLESLMSMGGLALGGFLCLWLCQHRRRSSLNLETNMKGQIVVITGSNCGIGFEAALMLARLNATIVLGCRCSASGSSAACKIRTTTGNHAVHFIHLDLSSFYSIRKFASVVNKRFRNNGGIDFLINNAGVCQPMSLKTETLDGFEIHFGVNHLGHFLLTKLILENNDSQHHCRVITISSKLMAKAEKHLDFSELAFVDDKIQDSGNVPLGYINSKLMNALFAQELSRRFDSNHVTSYAVCPGWCYTNLFRYMKVSFFRKICMLPVILLFMKSASTGASCIVRIVLEKEEQLINGSFYFNNSKDVYDMSVYSPEISAKLWDLSETYIRPT